MAQPIPQRLGKYPITGVIGRGAMGVVYRGVDPVIKRAVAIKTIRKELVEGDEHTEAMSDRFRHEAQAAGRLSHPGIVAVYEYGEDAQHAFIAMEYVEGNSLREYLARDTGFDERDSVSIMAQLLDALQFAHDHSVWHRDIKPANIMVMSNGRSRSPTSASRASSRATSRRPTSSWARRASSRPSSTWDARSTTASTSSRPACSSITCWPVARLSRAGPRQ